MNKTITKHIFPFLKSKLAIRLSLYIFSTAIAITLLLGTFQVFRAYNIEKELLQKEFRQIEKVNVHAIEENLWVLNFSSLKIILEGLLQKQNFVYFKLSDDKEKTLLEVGEFPKKNFILKKFPLYHNDAYGKKIYLGTLTVVATTKYINDNIFKNSVTTLVILFITMLLVGFSILLLIWFFISRHLFKIRSYTSNIRFDQKTAPLKLERKENAWTRNDVLTSLVDAFNTMQKKVHDAYLKLEHQSLYDSLTDLPNRRSLQIDLEKRIQECTQRQEFAALFFMDLDFFKVLNDSLGHTVGDKFLIEIAKRLQRLQEKHKFKIYRIGGDEFLILTQTLSQNEEESNKFAEQLAKDIHTLFEKEISLGNRTIKMSISTGIEIFQKAEDAETIIKHADTALYRAKEEGRNRFAFFYNQMQSNADKRLEIEQLLHQVIENDNLITYFQPKFDSERKIRSAETLIRMKGENGELIPPGDFIPLAQETGMILELDRQIVRKVFQFIQQNRQNIESSTLKSIAINISPNQFIMADFSNFIINEAKGFNIDPTFIILEITEEAVVSNVDYALKVMLQLKQYGFKFSIDDFGTGYSSMRYLMDFPLSELKIDKSFIDHILDSERYRAVIKTITTLAQNLHLNIVAEGVETPEQLEAIYKYGDVLIQGYVFSRPLPKEEFLQLLKENG